MRLLGSIAPEVYSAPDLTQYFGEFNEEDDPHSGQGMIESIAWLKECLSRIDADHVGLLMIA